MEGTTKYRIKTGGAIIMAAFALFLDLVSLIPFVGDFAGPIFWIIAAVYLYIAGIKLLDGKRLAVMGADMVIKMIPYLQELPVELLIGWLAIVVMTRIEDKTGISLNPLKKPGITPPRNQITPHNIKPGIRGPNQNQKNTNEKTNEKKDGEEKKNPQSDQGEINTLKDNIKQWESELEALKTQFEQLKQEEKEYRDGYADLIRRKREEGINDNELYDLERGYLMGPKDGGKKTEISSKINNLEQMLFGAKNKLIELTVYSKK